MIELKKLKNKLILNIYKDSTKRFRNTYNIPFTRTKSIEQPEPRHQIKNHVITTNIYAQINNKYD